MLVNMGPWFGIISSGYLYCLAISLSTYFLWFIKDGGKRDQSKTYFNKFENIAHYSRLYILTHVRSNVVIRANTFEVQELENVVLLKGVRAGGWTGGRREIVCLGCISETVRCRKFILGRDIGWGV